MAADEEKETNRHNANTLSGSGGNEEFDYYGVWVKSGPEDVSESEEDDSDSIFDLEISDEDELTTASGTETTHTPAGNAADVDSSAAGTDNGDSDTLTESEEYQEIFEELEAESSDDDSPPIDSIGIPDADEIADLSEEEEALLADLESADDDIDTPAFEQTEVPPAEVEPSEVEPSDDELEFRFADSDEELPDLELDDSDDLSLDDDQLLETHGFSSQDAAGSESSDHVNAEEIDETWQEPSAPGADTGPVTEIELEAADVAGNFDDVSAVADEMSEPISPEDGRGAYSKEAFDRIQGELTDIKSELAALRSELAVLRGGRSSDSNTQPAAAGATSYTADLPVEDSEPIAEDGGLGEEGLVFEPEAPDTEINLAEESEGGFFDEEDDETIALTGDELDNILNTAEFTEEVGEPTDLDDGDLDLDLSTVESDDYSFSDDTFETDATETTTEEGAHFEDEAFVFDDHPEVDQNDSSAIGAEAPDTGNAEADIFGASDDEVDVLANMDIDSELADIDALDDEEPSVVSESQQDTLDSDETVHSSESQEGTGSSAVQIQDTPEETVTTETRSGGATDELPENLKEEIKSVLSYMDQLLESLPEEKIREFAHSEHFEVYKRLFEELGLEP